MAGDSGNIINIDLDSRDEYVNEYDDGVLNTKLHNYIIDRAMDIDEKKKIIIKVSIKFKCSKKERDMIENMIVNDIEKGCCNKKKIKSYSMMDIYFGILGIGCVIVSFMFSYLHFSLVSEIFMVIGWVFLWEVVENVMFLEHDERKRRRKYLQLKRGMIIFD